MTNIQENREILVQYYRRALRGMSSTWPPDPSTIGEIGRYMLRMVNTNAGDLSDPGLCALSALTDNLAEFGFSSLRLGETLEVCLGEVVFPLTILFSVDKAGFSECSFVLHKPGARSQKLGDMLGFWVWDSTECKLRVDLRPEIMKIIRN